MSVEITKTNNARELSEQELDTVAGGGIRPLPYHCPPRRPTPIRKLINWVQNHLEGNDSNSAE